MKFDGNSNMLVIRAAALQIFFYQLHNDYDFINRNVLLYAAWASIGCWKGTVMVLEG